MDNNKCNLKDLQFYELMGTRKTKDKRFRTIGFTFKNEVIASLCFELKTTKQAYLMHIQVKEGWRRLGLAKQLISILKNRFDSIYGYSLLDVISFYQHLGFTMLKTQLNNQFAWKKPQNGVETSKATVFGAISEKET